jgi:LmbE family N-acetylglucosaminyl deacetylase
VAPGRRGGGRAALSADVVLAPHPDDEVLGAAAVLLHGPSTVVFVTDGVPPWVSGAEAEALRGRRTRECDAAWRVLGADVGEVVRVGLDDLTVWRHVEELAGALVDLLSGAGPTTVHVPAYQGGHPDHDATFAAAVLARARCPHHRWRVYGLYGYNAACELRFAELGPHYVAAEVVGRTNGDLARKADALRRFESQLRPGSVVQRWLDRPVAEASAPLPGQLPPPTWPCFYEDELGFEAYGVTESKVRAALDRAVTGS